MKPPKVRNYPKTIRVRGEEYKIKFVRRIPSNDPEDLGLCDPGERILYIRLKQSRIDIFKTYVHEVVHAIEAENDFDIPHARANDIFSKLADGLAEVLLNNFEVIEQLQDKPTKSASTQNNNKG
jgi:hypothetical protein